MTLVDSKVEEFEDLDEMETEGPSQEMREIYEESLRDILEGDIVKGTILEVREDVAMVDIGYKSEGLISLREFRGPSGEMTAKVGDVVEFTGSSRALKPTDGIGV